MPTYEYVCEACGHAFDEFQSITAKPLRKCPQCGKSALKRLIGTGAGILFKGSGFYCTDYRGESYKKAAGSESATSTTKTAEKKQAKTESTAAPAATKTESSSAQKKRSA